MAGRGTGRRAPPPHHIHQTITSPIKLLESSVRTDADGGNIRILKQARTYISNIVQSLKLLKISFISPQVINIPYSFSFHNLYWLSGKDSRDLGQQYWGRIIPDWEEDDSVPRRQGSLRPVTSLVPFESNSQVAWGVLFSALPVWRHYLTFPPLTQFFSQDHREVWAWLFSFKNHKHTLS